MLIPPASYGYPEHFFMKTTRTISIKYEVWEKARLKTDSVSGTIERLLEKWVEVTPDRDDAPKIEKLKAELLQKSAELEKLKQEKEKEEKKNKVLYTVGEKDDPRNRGFRIT